VLASYDARGIHQEMGALELEGQKHPTDVRGLTYIFFQIGSAATFILKHIVKLVSYKTFTSKPG
jgi:hypothetical protein